MQFCDEDSDVRKRCLPLALGDALPMVAGNVIGASGAVLAAEQHVAVRVHRFAITDNNESPPMPLANVAGRCDVDRKVRALRPRYVRGSRPCCTKHMCNKLLST